MADFYGEFVDFLRRPAVMETAVDILLCAVPIWVAVMIGLVIGWSWRPRWTGLIFLGLRSRLRFFWTAPPGFGARRLWLAFTAFSALSVCRKLWSNLNGKAEEGVGGGGGGGGEGGWSISRVLSLSASRNGRPILKKVEGAEAPNGSTTSQIVRTGSSEWVGDGFSPNAEASDGQQDQDIVTEKDLEHLLHFLDGKVVDSTWQQFMERTTPNMVYQAWRHEPEDGPLIYRSRTVFEDATPELVRDFFWDDDFRPKWDTMLAYFKVLEELPHIGSMIVHWIKKFPFFCSDREYIIGRRIWESGNTYYCVTKGVPYTSLPSKDKPRRVDLYFSSWRIRAVESRRRDGQLSACEVTLIHHEEMGIPKDVAKVCIRHGMWGVVKKLQSGMRAYQVARSSGASLSRCALMAQITTKIPVDVSTALLEQEPSEVADDEEPGSDAIRVHQGIDWKWVVIGGSVAVVLGLQAGVVGKALLFGAARRFARK
ncbi:hypothetical protein J5N97_010653 [Dioscorea zingiberensis]|uniref:START domain-containing protein n=1 Tax=Dioscorea zingiberensis TaxID=325984 RepID=A0A9D5HMV4_9LILI|nr:hypothetical protein J5N97_010653 [Dioscorea zingiberensis]